MMLTLVLTNAHGCRYSALAVLVMGLGETVKRDGSHKKGAGRSGGRYDDHADEDVPEDEVGHSSTSTASLTT